MAGVARRRSVRELVEAAPAGTWEARMAELMRAGVDEFTARRRALAEVRGAGVVVPLRRGPEQGGRVVSLVESAGGRVRAGAGDRSALAEAAALPAAARALFEQWRALGRTPAEALEEVRRSGLAERERLREAFQRRGLSAEAARIAAAGRDGGEPAAADPFDRLVESFRRRGMSAEAARIAAMGRGGWTESEVRARMREAAAVADVEAAFAAAARAAADRYGWDVHQAVAHVKRKAAEWAGVSLQEGAARLRAYAAELSR